MTYGKSIELFLANGTAHSLIIAELSNWNDNVKVLINALGYKVLEPMVLNDPDVSTDNEKLYLTAGNAKAEGYVTTEGFVVLAGAVINEKTSEKSLGKGILALRNKLLDSDKVDNYTTTEDILFSSSSAAADFATGYSVSGPMTWKNSTGVSLKEVESQ